MVPQRRSSYLTNSSKCAGSRELVLSRSTICLGPFHMCQYAVLNIDIWTDIIVETVFLGDKGMASKLLRLSIVGRAICTRLPGPMLHGARWRACQQGARELESPTGGVPHTCSRRPANPCFGQGPPKPSQGARRCPRRELVGVSRASVMVLRLSGPEGSSADIWAAWEFRATRRNTKMKGIAGRSEKFPLSM